MNIPPFWVRLKINEITATGWSFTSREDAENCARTNAPRIAERLASGGFDERGKLYYPDRPMREPIMQEFRDDDGNLTGVVTRNSYGSLVLNTARTLFIDVDLPTPSPARSTGLSGLIGALFGTRKPEPEPIVDPVEAIIAKAEAWERAHAPWHWRIYRTKAGVRLLATHASFEPTAPIVQEVFEALGADSLYRRLCASQQCFRARLTPKAWRCDYFPPQARWPFKDAKAEADYREWEDGYLERCREWSTCDLLKTTGTEPVNPTFAELVTFHDSATRVGSGLPLA